MTRDNVEGLSGVTILCLGGNCPVQAEGTVDGQPFYFRSRGDSWQFHVGPEEDWFTGKEWWVDHEFGEWPSAGWITDEEAKALIAQGVAEYRKHLQGEQG